MWRITAFLPARGLRAGDCGGPVIDKPGCGIVNADVPEPAEQTKP